MKRIRISVMAAFAAMAIGTGFTGCSKDDDDNRAGVNYTISGNASGSQMVPSVAGNGTGNITGTYNSSTGVMNYTTTWNGLSGAPNSGGFYTGASGTSGVAMGSPWTWGTGLTGTGTTSGSVTLSSAQASQLTSGNMYYSMGTASNTGGEVRGQMTATATP